MNIHRFWQVVLAQDREALRAFFHQDAHVNWHCTNERFSLEEYIIANCDYPGDWDGTVQRIEQLGDLVVTVTNVYPRDRSASFHDDVLHRAPGRQDRRHGRILGR